MNPVHLRKKNQIKVLRMILLLQKRRESKRKRQGKITGLISKI